MTITAEDYARLKPLLIQQSHKANRWDTSYSEDDVHDAFVALMATDAAVGNVASWLWSAARFRALHRYRDEKRHARMLAGASRPEAYDDGTQERLEAEQRMHLALRLIEALAQRQREIVKRWAIEGQTAEQVMEGLGLTDMQFQQSRYMALQRLRRAAVRRGMA